jgi:hypothetical protein
MRTNSSGYTEQRFVAGLNGRGHRQTRCGFKDHYHLLCIDAGDAIAVQKSDPGTTVTEVPKAGSACLFLDPFWNAASCSSTKTSNAVLSFVRAFGLRRSMSRRPASPPVIADSQCILLIVFPDIQQV